MNYAKAKSLSAKKFQRRFGVEKRTFERMLEAFKRQFPDRPKAGQPWELGRKDYNRELAKERIGIEHVNRRLKIFKIFAERYHNRRRRYGLRCNLLAAIYSYELSLST